MPGCLAYFLRNTPGREELVQPDISEKTDFMIY